MSFKKQHHFEEQKRSTFTKNGYKHHHHAGTSGFGRLQTPQSMLNLVGGEGLSLAVFSASESESPSEGNSSLRNCHNSRAYTLKRYSYGPSEFKTGRSQATTHQATNGCTQTDSEKTFAACFNQRLAYT